MTTKHGRAMINQSSISQSSTTSLRGLTAWGGAGLATMIGIGLICLLAACAGASATSQPGPVVGGTEAPSTPAAVCAGADLSGLKSVVYVKADGADGSFCGATTGNACKTIQQGINNCAAAGCGVLVRHGLYPTTATITLRDAVSLYGSCLFDGETDRQYRTMVQAGPASGTPAISASGINTPITVSGLVVIGKDETANGTASIAMAVSDSKGLTLIRSVLVAGKGSDGATGGSSNGVKGGDGFSPSCATCRGAAGNACPSSPPPTGIGSGGAGAAQNNVATSGCVGNCHCWNNNSPDSVGIAGQDSGSAKGGGGMGPASSGCSREDRPSYFGTVDSGDGSPGGAGDTGQCSLQGGTPSNLIYGQTNVQGTTWLPSSGGVGPTGSVGAGGGGGGSGGYATDGGSPDLSGYPGGGGGGGGCGGPGGQGGQQGGASLALVLSNSTVAGFPDQSSIVPGPGGHGGPGGQGGLGGPGGNGGSGYRGPKYNYKVILVCYADASPGYGGPGGHGGQGGAGGGGAGGNGGPSVGIALRGNSPAPVSNNGIYLGQPGTGGAAGGGGVNPNCTGARGAAGVGGGAATVVDFDKPPADVLSSGQRLAKGEQRISANSKYTLLMQTDGNLCLKTYPALDYIWCSAQNNLGFGDSAQLSQDGNLCLSTNGSNTKCTNTAGHPGAYLTVRDDGHVVIYDGSAQLWTIP